MHARAHGLGSVAAADRQSAEAGGGEGVRPKRGSTQAPADLEARVTTRSGPSQGLAGASAAVLGCVPANFWETSP
jgi:hypothetical protein